jgi:hypothetical protein
MEDDRVVSTAARVVARTRAGRFRSADHDLDVTAAQAAFFFGTISLRLTRASAI